MDRRDFLRRSVGSAVTLAAGSAIAQGKDAAVSGSPSSSNAAGLPKRAYGNTGIDLSIIGFGGIIVTNAEQAHANRVVA